MTGEEMLPPGQIGLKCWLWQRKPFQASTLDKASSFYTVNFHHFWVLLCSGEFLKIDLIFKVKAWNVQKALSLIQKYENCNKKSYHLHPRCIAINNCVIFSLPHSLTSFCGTQWRQRCSWMLFTCWVLGHLTTTFQLEIDMYKIDFIRL